MRELRRITTLILLIFTILYSTLQIQGNSKEFFEKDQDIVDATQTASLIIKRVTPPVVTIRHFHVFKIYSLGFDNNNRSFIKWKNNKRV